MGIPVGTMYFDMVFDWHIGNSGQQYFNDGTRRHFITLLFELVFEG